MYLPDDLKWKRWTDLETDEIECIRVEVEKVRTKKFSCWLHLQTPRLF